MTKRKIKMAKNGKNSLVVELVCPAGRHDGRDGHPLQNLLSI